MGEHALVAEQVSTRFGVVSFATDPYHPLLWSHYTADGSGFAIGYDTGELRKVAGSDEHLRSVSYHDRPPPIGGPVVLASPESNLPVLLSLKSSRWAYENEWRMIIELDRTIGTGKADRHGQPINLVRIPNRAVVSVHYTERTPRKAVASIRVRLADQNNRYQAGEPRKLVLSPTVYGYEEAEGG